MGGWGGSGWPAKSAAEPSVAIAGRRDETELDVVAADNAAGMRVLAAHPCWNAWKTIPASISEVTGTHTVYLELPSRASGRPPFLSLHCFNFPVSWSGAGLATSGRARAAPLAQARSTMS